MPFLPPNQQRQSTEGILYTAAYNKLLIQLMITLLTREISHFSHVAQHKWTHSSSPSSKATYSSLCHVHQLITQER